MTPETKLRSGIILKIRKLEAILYIEIRMSSDSVDIYHRKKVCCVCVYEKKLSDDHSIIFLNYITSIMRGCY